MSLLCWLVGSLMLVSSTAPVEYPFAAKVTGTGKPMILIPGLCCSGEVWDGTVAHFKDRYECHVLTLAGFAGQPAVKTDGSYSETIARGIAKYARDKKLDKPAIVGHSLGGFIAFKLAATEPDLFGPVISVDGFPAAAAIFMPDATDAQRQAFAGAFLKKFDGAKPEDFPTMMKDLFGSMLSNERLGTVMKWAAASDPKTIARAMRDVFTADARPGLEKVKAPILLLGAYHDAQKQFLSSQDEFEKRLKLQVANAKKGQVAVRANCKHFIMYDEPKWMFEKMETVLGK